VRLVFWGSPTDVVFYPPCPAKEFDLFVGAPKAARNKKFECVYVQVTPGISKRIGGVPPGGGRPGKDFSGGGSAAVLRQTREAVDPSNCQAQPTMAYRMVCRYFYVA